MKIFAKTIEDGVIMQLNQLIQTEIFDESTIRVMPDTHSGKGCVIGFTVPIKDKIVPNLVGVDIGCGILTINLGKIDINLKELDEFIYHNIPHGKDVYKNIDMDNSTIVHVNELLKDLKAIVNVDRALKSIGTLGGGNHYIEIDEDNDGNKYLQIHCGSRHLGVEVCQYHQNIAIQKKNQKINQRKSDIINNLKSLGKESDIQQELDLLKFEPQIIDSLAYLEDDDLKNYLNDMSICQRFAQINRDTILCKILQFIGINDIFEVYGRYPRPHEFFHTVHNYIDFEDGILRKGAIACRKNQMVTIGLNMRDGSLICKGKGNEDWNCSGPHGAGRLMSRTAAKNQIKLKDFRNSMEGIYTTSINKSTIDESPFAYKDYQEIIDVIDDTVEIIEHIKPVYNFKASE